MCYTILIVVRNNCLFSLRWRCMCSVASKHIEDAMTDLSQSYSLWVYAWSIWKYDCIICVLAAVRYYSMHQRNLSTDKIVDLMYRIVPRHIPEMIPELVVKKGQSIWNALMVRLPPVLMEGTEIHTASNAGKNRIQIFQSRYHLLLRNQKEVSLALVSICRSLIYGSTTSTLSEYLRRP